MQPLSLQSPATSAPSTAHVSNGVSEKRAALFREPALRRIQRIAYGIAYLIQPKRIADLPALSRAVIASCLRGGVDQPDEKGVHASPEGFAGTIANATPQSLLAAHRAGFFPQAHMGPQKWWTRAQRYVQFLDERRLPKTLRYEMRKAKLTLTFDQAFDDVIAACAEPRPGRPKLTWITPDIMHLYARLHDAGHAHSFEVWDEAGQLVGGGYGVAIGRIFVTESLFSRVPSASKMGLQFLNFHLGAWGFVLNDVKDFAPHFAGAGSRHIPGSAYSALLAQYAHADLPANPNVVAWTPHASLAEIAKLTVNPPEAARAIGTSVTA
jgi:leucyl/phenylalanyl-tRNA---protein transferase